MTKLNNVLELLEKNDYVVKVKQIENGSGCLITIPIGNTFQYITYLITDTNSLTISLSYNDEYHSEELIISEYLIRPLILLNLITQCKVIGYNKELVCCYNENNELIDFNDVLNSPTNNNEQEKENILMSVLNDVLKKGLSISHWDIAMQHGVFQGLKILLGVTNV